jgi:import inner membrane translocase subunit TIM22
MGLLMGVVLGGFSAMGPPMPFPGAPEPPPVAPLRALRESGEMVGARSLSWARNFAKVGAVFSLVECSLEKVRARHDTTNVLVAGCVTGAFFARAGGPAAMAAGCGGFAAFSAAMELLLPHAF